MPVADFVLATPKKEQADEFEDAVQTAAEAALFLLDNGLDKTQQKFN